MIEFSAEPEDEVIEFTEEPVLAPVEAPVEEDGKLMLLGKTKIFFYLNIFLLKYFSTNVFFK